MATHSSLLAQRIPWTEEPGGLWSMGLDHMVTIQRLNNSLSLQGAHFSTLICFSLVLLFSLSYFISTPIPSSHLDCGSHLVVCVLEIYVTSENDTILCRNVETAIYPCLECAIESYIEIFLLLCRACSLLTYMNDLHHRHHPLFLNLILLQYPSLLPFSMHAADFCWLTHSTPCLRSLGHSKPFPWKWTTSSLQLPVVL